MCVQGASTSNLKDSSNKGNSNKVSLPKREGMSKAAFKSRKKGNEKQPRGQHKNQPPRMLGIKAIPFVFANWSCRKRKRWRRRCFPSRKSNDTCFSECGTTFRMPQCRPENETQAPTEAAPSRTICTAGYQVESEPMYQIPLELRECHDRFSFNSCLLRCP
jgi:hypothetical protein